MTAFQELYKGYRYLKNFSVLNVLAISKILKKHDKNSKFRTRSIVLSIVRWKNILDEQTIYI